MFFGFDGGSEMLPLAHRNEFAGFGAHFFTLRPTRILRAPTSATNTRHEGFPVLGPVVASDFVFVACDSRPAISASVSARECFLVFMIKTIQTFHFPNK